jgi:hypothetical protein
MEAQRILGSMDCSEAHQKILSRQSTEKKSKRSSREVASFRDGFPGPEPVNKEPHQ